MEITMKIDATDVAAMIDGTQKIFMEVLAERQAQDAQWGGPAHDDEHSGWDWNRYIQYQLRCAESILHGVPGPKPEGTWRGRMIKIAALAIAAVESRDRVMADQPSTEGETK
jgi:hypothetical protein